MTPAEFHAARAALGLTQQQLADALESNIRSVQKWEAGERATRGRNGGIPGPVSVALRCIARLRRLGLDYSAAD